MNHALNLVGVRCDRSDAARMLLSLREAVIIAEVPEERVRKDIETGVLAPPVVFRIADHRLCTHWAYVFTLAAVYGNHYLNGRLRKIVLSRMDHFLEHESHFNCYLSAGSNAHWTRVNTFTNVDMGVVQLDKYVSLDFNKVFHAVRPRIDLYTWGLGRIEEKAGVLGGDAVFKGTRLPVFHVGKMYERGESLENILADYPVLTEDDVKFAKLYSRAHPPVGRPRESAEAHSDSNTSAA